MCVHANREWEALSGFSSADMTGEKRAAPVNESPQLTSPCCRSPVHSCKAVSFTMARRRLPCFADLPIILLFVCAGRTLSCLQGPATHPEQINQLVQSVAEKKACVIPDFINYDKRRLPFRHCVSITPLTGLNGSVGLFRITSTCIPPPLNHPPIGATSMDLSLDRALSLSQDGSHDLRQSVESEFSALIAQVATGAAAVPASSASAEGFARGGNAFTSLFRFDASLNAPLDTSLDSSLDASLDEAVLTHPDSSLYVLMHTEAPFPIVWASDAWLSFCGFSCAEILGTNLECIQGPATDPGAIGLIMAAAHNKSNVQVELINYTKARKPFRHTVSVVYVPASPTHPTAIFQLKSTNVQILGRGSGGGILAPRTPFSAPSDVLVAMEAATAEKEDEEGGVCEEEEPIFWSDEYEEYVNSMDSYAKCSLDHSRSIEIGR